MGTRVGRGMEWSLGGLMTHQLGLSCADAHAKGERIALPMRSLAALAVVSALTLALGACAEPVSAPHRASLAAAPTDQLSSPAAPDSDDPQIGPEPTSSETPSGGQPWDERATRACEAAVGPGFDQVAQSPDDAGTTTFWTSGRRWIACDLAADAVEPRLIESTRRSGHAGFDERSLAVTSAAVPGPDQGAAPVRFFGGGRLPWPVQELSYTFPDGHVEQARFVTSQDDPDEVWWTVTYTPVEGVLVDPATQADDLKPVTISIVGAAVEAFRLPWEDLQRSE